MRWWLELLRSCCYLGFGAWSGIRTWIVPGFTWLHALFLLLALVFVAAGILPLVDIRRSAPRFVVSTHYVISGMLVVLGGVLLLVAGSPFGALAIGLGAQAAVNAHVAGEAKRPVPSSGNGPLQPDGC